MTDDELKDLVASLAICQKETDRQIMLLRESQQVTDSLQKETARQLQETDKQIMELRLSQQETEKQTMLLRETQRESLRASQLENDRQFTALRLSQQETDRQIKETDLQLKETDRQLRRQLKELSKQIGGLGQKFGGFTEGMALPSMTKILTEQFGMEVVTPRVKVKKSGDTLELDVFAYANSSRNEAYVVEIKSHLRPDGIEQLRNILERFRRFLPEHNDKKLYGILAVVDAPDDLRQQALTQGFYMACIHDEQFLMETPAGFVPKSW